MWFSSAGRELLEEAADEEGSDKASTASLNDLHDDERDAQLRHLHKRLPSVSSKKQSAVNEQRQEIVEAEGCQAPQVFKRPSA